MYKTVNICKRNAYRLLKRITLNYLAVLNCRQMFIVTEILGRTGSGEDLQIR